MNWTRRDLGRLGLGAGALAALPGPPFWRRSATGAEAGMVTAHGVSAFGDLRYPADFTHFEYAEPAAPKGGEFSTGYGNVTFDSLNPFILKGSPAIGLTIIHDSLMVASGDEPDSLYGLIAESIEYPADRSFAIFRLRPEARFHDGSPITAEDVRFTVDALVEKGHPTYRILLAPVEQVSVVDTRTVRFDFAAGAPKRDLPMLVAGLPVISAAYYETRDFAESTLEPPLGSSAYRIGPFEAGRNMVFERVEDYWARDLPVNLGRHNFDRIRFEYFRDRSAAFEAFKAGSFTFNEEFWSKLWATGYDFPAVQRGDVVMETIPDESTSGSQGYWFNLRREKFADVRVREAIANCFDFEWSNQRLFFNLYSRTDSFFEGGPMQAEGLPTPGELRILERFADRLPTGFLDQPAYVPPVSDGSGRNRKALRRAAKLLDTAGWKAVGGKRVKDGQTLEIEFLLGSQGFDRITGPFIKNLERIGVTATMRTIDPAQYKNRTDEFDFDIVVDRKAMALTPGDELRDYFGSASANSRGSQNTAGIADPVVDGLLEIIARADSRETLTSAVKALDRVLRSMHIWIPQWHKASHNLAYWDIYDRPAIKPRFQRGVIDLWWIDREKEARLKAEGRL